VVRLGSTRLCHDLAVSKQRSESVTISDDGAMTMNVWVPEAGHGPGILLLQEIWGVGTYIRAVAERLSEVGYVVGAPDVFWRFAPGWAASHDEAGTAASFEQAGKLDREQAIADCVAACAHLGGLGEVDGRSGVLGFCLGGTLAFGVAVDDDPAVCVSYYGSGVPAMVDRLDSVSCPALFHFGRDDSYIPADGVEALAKAMDGRADVVLNVEAAGHAFDNHESATYYEESAARAAWAKTMAFLTEHLPVQ
jgi:carboxymethylenebutenolidase